MAVRYGDGDDVRTVSVPMDADGRPMQPFTVDERAFAGLTSAAVPVDQRRAVVEEAARRTQVGGAVTVKAPDLRPGSFAGGDDLLPVEAITYRFGPDGRVTDASYFDWDPRLRHPPGPRAFLALVPTELRVEVTNRGARRAKAALLTPVTLPIDLVAAVADEALSLSAFA